MADNEHGHHHHHHHHHGYLQMRFRYFLHVLFKYLSFLPLVSVLFLLGIFPIFYYGGRLWWQWLALSILVSSCGFWAVSSWWRGGNSLDIRPLAAFFLLPLAYGLFQLLQCSAIVEALSPKAASLISDFNGLGLGVARKCLSLAPDATIEKLGIILVCLLFFTLVCSQFRNQLYIKLLMWALSLGAFLNATLAFMQNFMGKGGMASIAPFTGTFINRNHFGFLMMIGILSSMGLLVINTSSTVRSRRAAVNDGRKTRPLFNALLSLFIFIEFSALVLTQSRGAFIGVGVALVVFFIGWIVKERNNMRDKGRQLLLAFVALTVSALLCALPFAMERLSQRYKTLLDSDLTMNDRIYVWRITLNYIGDFWKTGSGIGSYRDLIERYEEGRVTQQFIDHAHNDYLELAAECGVPFTCILLGLLLWYVGSGFKRVWHSGNVNYRWCGWAALSALIGCMVHELFEFNMQAWSNSLAVTALLAVLSISCRHGIEPLPANEAAHQAICDARFKWRLPLLFLGLLLFCLVPTCIQKFKAAMLYSEYQARHARQNIFWTPGRRDYEQRIGILTSVDRKLPCYRAESKLATLYANLAGMEQKPSQENWRKACDYAAMAMKRAPVDGNFALLCAEIFSRANACGARMDSDWFVLQLFLWAHQCIPFKQKALHNTAMEAFKYYVKSLSIYPDEVAESRQRALRLLVSCMNTDSSHAVKYIPYIAQVVENKQQLKELCSGGMETRIALSRYFAMGGDYDASLEIIDDILKAKATGVALPSEEEYKLLDWRCGIYRLRRDEEHWRQDCEQLNNICHAKKMRLLAEARQLAEKSGNQEAVSKLVALEYMNPALPEYIMMLAQQYQFLGRNTDCLHLLLTLSYGEKPPATKLLLQAWDMLLPYDKNPPRDMEAIRHTFLGAAIQILLAENGEKPIYDVRQAIEKLENLEKRYQGSSWLQFHLIPFFIGRGCECLGLDDRAIDAYRRALKISPRNLYVLKRMKRLTADGVTDAQLEILRFADKCKRPLSIVSPNLIFMGFKSNTECVEALHSKLKLDMLALCTGDIKSEYHFSMQFYDKKGTCFRNDFDWSGTTYPMVSWRVGEVHSSSFEGQPHLLALKGAKRPLEQGNVSVSVSVSVLKHKLQPVPSIVEHLWKVK